MRGTPVSQRNERSSDSDPGRASQWLIHHVARRAPEPLSSRLEEEWLADLESRSSALSRLRFAVGCCWATVVIANDCARSRVAAASSAMSAGGIITLADRNFGYFSLRSATLFLIAGLHGALFYGMITTLSHTRGPATPPDLQNHEWNVPPEKAPPLPPGMEMKGWTINVPKPVIDVPRNIDLEKEVTTQDGEITEPYPPPAPPERPTHVIQRVAGGPGGGFPETADFYPSPSIRLGEEGISIVRVCVDARGRLTSAPSTMTSSGSARLDQAALKLARAGSGRYRANTEDGQPVDSCYPFGVRFQLKR